MSQDDFTKPSRFSVSLPAPIRFMAKAMMWGSILLLLHTFTGFGGNFLVSYDRWIAKVFSNGPIQAIVDLCDYCLNALG